MRAKAYIVHRAMCEPELEWSKPKDCISVEPLYTKREWQGLTEEEIEAMGLCAATKADIQDIEAKLKEKNTWQDGDCKHCVNGCPACDARRQSNVLL